VRKVSVLCTLVLVAVGAQAIDVGSFKRVTDRMGSSLVEQYDLKGKGFGSAEQQKDLELTAIIVAGLCGSPREYRESHGPFISEPIKFIVASFNEDGSPKGSPKDEASAAAWSAKALKASENEKYHGLVEKIHARLKRPAAPASFEADAQKFAKFTTLPPAEQASVVTVLGHALKDNAKTEVTIDGAKIGLGQLVLDTLDKVENKTGKVSDDLRVNALAFNLSIAAYKAMK